ncbi:MAG: AAA family ATPase [Roseibium sp.]|nr:AAA family ATPase [Roseibium sp.]
MHAIDGIQGALQERVFAFLSALPSDDPAQPEVERIDTHANVVFLAGTKAYKVKRAVTFPFLDYSTLARREAACKRELIYNSRHAANLYLDAVPITETPAGGLELGGPGPVVEWAVKMNRFDTSQQLDHIAAHHRLPAALIDALADMMVQAHDAAEPRAADGFYHELETYLAQNKAAFADHPDLFPPAEAAHLAQAAENRLASLRELILKRGDQGLIRLCHGDAHMRNIVLIDDEPVLFDAVEFSDAIATGDVLYDLAYLLMDLWEHDQKPAANRIFNRYLDKSHRAEDADGLAALPFYLMMRAAIRAKISASSAAVQADPEEKTRQQKDARAYFELALSCLEPSEPTLIGLGGLSGTGKTTLAYGLAPSLGRVPGARVLRTDVERKARLGLADTEPAPMDAYSRAASDAVYDAVCDQARRILAAGHSALFDAVFADEAERAHAETLAGAAEASFCGLWLTAPKKVMIARVENRFGDASDATRDVIDLQSTYDVGRMTWTPVDASGTPEDTLQKARAALSKCGVVQSP